MVMHIELSVDHYKVGHGAGFPGELYLTLIVSLRSISETRSPA